MQARLFRILLSCLLVGIGLLALKSARAQDDDQLPTMAELEDTWSYLEPSGETSCAFGDPFGFFVHPGSSAHLMIAFGGGYICWDSDANSCLEFRESQVIDVDFWMDYFEHSDGILEMENPANPLHDYTIVIVPHCTGDTHLGHSMARYGEGDEAIDFAHNGFANVSAVLEWVYANVTSPEEIYVAGVSAGMPASILYAPSVIEHYPSASVAQLGNGLGAFPIDADTFATWGTADILPEWMPEFDGITPETLTFETLYVAAATHYPDYVFAQSNTAHDANLSPIWSSATGGTPPFEEALTANMHAIAEQVPNFRYYIAGGTTHVLTTNRIFYTVRVDDVLFSDWFAALLNGEAVENVACTQCDVPDLGQDMAEPEPIENPTFASGSTITIPGPGFMLSLVSDPGGGTGQGGMCTVGTEATVGQTVQTAAGEIWVELQCAGMSGWTLEETLSP